MKRIVVSVVLALSLIAGMGTVSLAFGPPDHVEDICEAVAASVPGPPNSDYDCPSFS